VQPIVHESIVEGEAIGAVPESKKEATTNAGAKAIEAMTAEVAPASMPETIQLGIFAWTQDAVSRLNRVPEGFMRDMTREKIEDYARQHEISLITLEVAEKGIEVGRQLMAEMIAGYAQVKREVGTETRRTAEGDGAVVAKTHILNEIPSVQGTHA
jgi:Proto-chlorophyllide reductase 57 kD subunit